MNKYVYVRHSLGRYGWKKDEIVFVCHADTITDADAELLEATNIVARKSPDVGVTIESRRRKQ